MEDRPFLLHIILIHTSAMYPHMAFTIYKKNLIPITIYTTSNTYIYVHAFKILLLIRPVCIHSSTKLISELDPELLYAKLLRNMPVEMEHRIQQ